MHSYAELSISIRDQQCSERYVAEHWYPPSEWACRLCAPYSCAADAGGRAQILLIWSPRLTLSASHGTIDRSLAGATGLGRRLTGDVPLPGLTGTGRTRRVMQWMPALKTSAIEFGDRFRLLRTTNPTAGDTVRGQTSTSRSRPKPVTKMD